MIADSCPEREDETTAAELADRERFYREERLDDLRFHDVYNESNESNEGEDDDDDDAR